MMTDNVTALFVERHGHYPHLVYVWYDIEGNAKRYNGPNPVVAHPPCARWCQLAALNQSLHGYMIGDDDGCFESALRSVERFGGILEHPANTLAFEHFGIGKPKFGMWLPTRKGWVTEIAQYAYGHLARKLTWLYMSGYDGILPLLKWRLPLSSTHQVSHCRVKDKIPLSQKEALATPIDFAKELIRIANMCKGSKP